MKNELKVIKPAKHMRIAALQCNFEKGRENTLKVLDLWQEFGFNVEQLFHTHGELYSAVFSKDKFGTMLEDYLKKADACDISIILYMNCHVILKSQDDKAPEWAQKDRDGKYTLLYGTYYGCCLNSSWLDYFLCSLESLKGYPIKGVFFDGPISLPCFCERCSEKFEDRYGLAMAGAPKALVSDFGLETAIVTKKLLNAKIKSINPEWLVYFNEALHQGKTSLEQIRTILSLNDIVGTEGGFQFYGPPQEADIWKCSLAAKTAEAVAGGKPTVIFMAGDHKPWSWYLHTPAETKLCYASVLANGASVWYGLHSFTKLLKSAAGEAIKSMVQFDRRHNLLYQNTESLAQVAVFHSFDTNKYYNSSGTETDFYDSKDNQNTNCVGDYSESTSGAVAALFHSSIPFDVLTEVNISDITGYRAVVMPTAACMSDETAEFIRRYVEQGGIIIADSEFSLYNETGARRNDFMLKDLMGCSFRGYQIYHDFDYFQYTESASEFIPQGIPYLPAPLTALNVEENGESIVLARRCPPLGGRYAGKPLSGQSPYIIKNQYGKGSCYYLAGTFFELYRKFGIVHYRNFIASVIKCHFRPEIEVLNAPPSLEISIRRNRDSGEVIIHLVNYSGGMTRPVDSVILLNNVALRIDGNFTQVDALVSGRQLAAENKIVRLPEIREFEVIVLHEK